MSEREQLIQEIEYLPEPLVKEVLNFLLSLKETASLQSFSSFADTVSKVENNNLSMTEDSLSLIDFIDQLNTEFPSQDVEKLPNDFAANLDHYLYGSPKTEE